MQLPLKWTYFYVWKFSGFPATTGATRGKPEMGLLLIVFIRDWPGEGTPAQRARPEF